MVGGLSRVHDLSARRAPCATGWFRPDFSSSTPLPAQAEFVGSQDEEREGKIEDEDEDEDEEREISSAAFALSIGNADFAALAEGLTGVKMNDVLDTATFDVFDTKTFNITIASQTFPLALARKAFALTASPLKPVPPPHCGVLWVVW